MIFLKEFRRCTTNEQCPNCGQLVNTTFSRIVKDSCGHTKCRMCLLYEEHGCKICQTTHCTRKNIQDYLTEPCITNENLNDIHNPVNDSSANEEIILPLELVINKDSKSKENCSDSNLIKHGSSKLYEKSAFDNDEEICESITNDAVTNNDSSKLCIPKIEPYNVILNIQTHLRNENDCDSKNLQNPHDSQTKVKISEKPVENSKNVKCHNRTHITIIPGIPEKYKCNVCSKIFRNKKGKCYHDACVTGIKPYQCTLCDKSFVKRSHFEYHERIHRGYKPYKCNLCEKAFPQQNKLNRHMLSHSKEKQFTCPECNKQYSKQDDLKNHLNIHNVTSIYNCKSCDKSFYILAHLKRHMQTHTNERPHKCDQCNKNFKDRSLLIRHKRIHGKERPFSCAHCNKVFLSKSELRRHLTVHSDEKPFSCKYCQTLFRRKDNLNRHIRHHHTEDFNREIHKVPVVKTDQACLIKNNQRQKQKSKKAQSKSTAKVTTTFANFPDQINSRLDSMGNITPVIRATNEVSNAVPVINGPINIRRLEDRTDKKIFTYTEPIPIAEAVVLNCRIEEKLYPQSANSHNYFVRSYLKDRNSKVNSYPNNKLASQENHNFVMDISPIDPLSRMTINQKDCTSDIHKEKIIRYEDEKDNQNEDEKKKDDERNLDKKRNFKDHKEDPGIISFGESNCVSTIKKHITQMEEHVNKNLANNDNSDIMTSSKDSQNKCRKKQNDIHWRRRIAETLKSC
ncbi:hypothetical protein P5V15_014261 [Pogonomyrmex californicus]